MEAAPSLIISWAIIQSLLVYGKIGDCVIVDQKSRKLLYCLIRLMRISGSRDGLRRSIDGTFLPCRLGHEPCKEKLDYLILRGRRRL